MGLLLRAAGLTRPRSDASEPAFAPDCTRTPPASPIDLACEADIDAGPPQAASSALDSSTIGSFFIFLCKRLAGLILTVGHAALTDRRLDLGAESPSKRIEPAGIAQGALDVDLAHALTPVVAQVRIVQRSRRLVGDLGHLRDQ